ncbi:MAG: TonB-dependent receptor [Mangrovibacterium sp.]
MKHFSLLLLSLCLAIGASAQISLSGTVNDAQGKPLSGATVVINDGKQAQLANADGVFEFKNLASGNYELKVSFVGFETHSESLLLQRSKQLTISLKSSAILADEVLVSATRAGNRTPVAKSDVSKEEIQSQNMGQDIPYLLTMTPSYVATSDAGAGVGYTYFRIRGTDMNRINVTIDGVPMNDAESQSVFFVDVPDLAGSLENIQVQRGVGTSTNGAGAFGASINMQTANQNPKAYATYRGAGGSFGTYKNSVSAGTGLMGKFAFDMRLSQVKSDGFIDRASSDLKSYYFSGGYYGEKTMIKLKVFSGFEETYQAWNGVPSVKLNNDTEGMLRYKEDWLWGSSERENEIRYEDLVNSNARTYNMYTYDHEVDNYTQNYYQLHLVQEINPYLNFNAALFLTRGLGYYENYKYDRKYTDYLMTAPEGQSKTDLVQRKWLDNYYYGATYALNYEQGVHQLTVGGAFSQYDGDHYGRVIWAQNMGSNDKDYEWYRGNGLKSDINIYAKYQVDLTHDLSLYTDLQYRGINYEISGTDDDLRDISQIHSFNFFNPKVGLFYQPSEQHAAYISYAQAHREPNRDNFVDLDQGDPTPVAETLNDFEAGYNFSSKKVSVGANLYGMFYKNQLVLTGEVNDVGSSMMINVDDSYRVGAEFTASALIFPKLRLDATYTFSQNKIKDFTEFVDDWDSETYEQKQNHLGKTDLAFSPNHVMNGALTYSPNSHWDIALISNFVGEQFIDNTSSSDRMLDSWFVSNLKVAYSLPVKFCKELKFHLMVNNIFNAEYESNAWVYSYYTGGERYKMDGYFPQAGTNFYFGLDVVF